jgi:hypothetical protein
MNRMNNFKQLHWALIVGMGALALIRPFLNITGLMEGLGRPFGPLFITALISVAWLAIVLFTKVKEPIFTLIFTGMTYGVFAILISAILSPILTGQLSGPITNPFAIVAVLITNAIWGMTIGLIAWGIQQLNQPQAR